MLNEKDYMKWLLENGCKCEGYVTRTEDLLKSYGFNHPIDDKKWYKVYDDLVVCRERLKEGKNVETPEIIYYLRNNSVRCWLDRTVDSISVWRKYFYYLHSGMIVISTETKGKKKPIYEKPLLKLVRGEDYDGYYIRYAEDVEMNERIPGLCLQLELEYEEITAYANELFGTEGSEWLKRIPVILRKGIPEPHFYPLSDDEKAQIILNMCQEGCGDISKDEIARIMNDSGVYLNTCGIYHHGEAPYIEIYFECFDACDFDEYMDKVIQVLAHEYMHHVHSISEINEHYNIKVSEALADFFSHLYLIYSLGADKYKAMAAYKRYSFWKKYFNTSIPYAYALYFMKKENHYMDFSDEYDDYSSAIDKFLSVFKESLMDAEKAFDLLIK